MLISTGEKEIDIKPKGGSNECGFFNKDFKVHVDRVSGLKLRISTKMKRQTVFINSGIKSIRLKLQKNFMNRFPTLLFDIVFNKHSLQLT